MQFYAPWCGHCKSLKPTWIDLAKQLSGKVKVGAVDCTEAKQTCQEYGVQGYPTIKWFGESKESPEDYQGGRDSGSLAAFATQHWSSKQPPPEVRAAARLALLRDPSQHPHLAASSSTLPRHPLFSTSPCPAPHFPHPSRSPAPPQLRELVDAATWEEHCVGHAADASLDLGEVQAKQLCIIAFLPHILDSKAAGREEHLQASGGGVGARLALRGDGWFAARVCGLVWCFLPLALTSILARSLATAVTPLWATADPPRPALQLPEPTHLLLAVGRGRQPARPRSQPGRGR